MRDDNLISRRILKRDARTAMRTHKPSVFLTAILFLLILLVLDSLSAKMQFPGMDTEEIMQSVYDGKTEMLIEAAASRTGSSYLLDVAIAVMSGMIVGGFCLFCLRVGQGGDAGPGTLFDLFEYFFRYLWLEIVIGFFIILWSMLLVIPGIIAAYRYSMALFVFFDDPDKSAMQCIQESKEMMRGRKLRLFILDLSMIGWILLSVIPLVGIFTAPYLGITRANFYRAASGQYTCESDEPSWNQ